MNARDIKNDLIEKEADEETDKKLVEICLGNYRIIVEIKDILEKYNDKNSLENFLSDKKNLYGLLEKIVLKDVETSESIFKNKLISYAKKSKQKNNEGYANVVYVSPEQLPSGNGWRALGMYDPSINTIYIANNLSPQEEKFVYYHEVAHSLGIRDEAEADNYAALRTGHRKAA